ncbi:MAG: cobalt-precorrin-6A reductase [Marinovum sp.]|nr:cobalt-precorrin-6A reductase [Marinovum sp.]
MSVNLLILAGTTEASQLAKQVSAAKIKAVLSYAGRVERPKPQPLPRRIGGFGGVEGLKTYLRENSITHVVDTTHPFAVQMSQHAVDACVDLDLPLMAFSRPEWKPIAGDNWTEVEDIPAAVSALKGAKKRIMLALGRMHLEAFAKQPHHRYLLRLVDPPGKEPSLPNHDIVVCRGPFTKEGDLALMRDYNIELVVCKNAGGVASRAKLDAARTLSLPVIMIARPRLDRPRLETGSLSKVMQWLVHSGTDLGV